MANELIADWAPPIARRFANRMMGAETRFRGPYPDWNSASAATAGYGHDDILSRVRASAAKVLAGEGGFEQDGVVGGVAPPSHALAALLAVAARNDGRLSVIDFGGSLASHWLRWRPWLATLRDVRWHVIEQPHFVEAGRNLFSAHPEITFDDTISTNPARPCNAVLVSGALQYLRDPFATLEALVALGASALVIDRTPCADDGRDLIVTQHAPWTIGRASYPMWLLSDSKMERCLGADHDLATRFASDDPPIRAHGIRGTYRGSFWIRRAAPKPRNHLESTAQHRSESDVA